MKQILAERNLQLTKSLGQNFLHDHNQLQRILQAADLRRSDKVLEIGPGLGPLTELLLQKAGEVLAIEKDKRLVQVLGEQFTEAVQTRTLNLVHDDALEYLRHKRCDWNGWKLVSNLPYSVASPLLVELAQAERGPDRMVATLQIEVAKRLMAKSGEPDYGVLTLLVQLEYEPQGWFKIPSGCFFPEPEVDSACVCLLRRSRQLLSLSQKRNFARIVKRSFSQRRKMMLKLLKNDWNSAALDKAFERALLPTSVRAEAVTLQQFAELTLSLDEQG